MTERRLNILFIASWYPSKINPKNGNFIERHAMAVSNFCNVTVLHAVSCDQSEIFRVETSKNVTVNEIIVYYKKVKFRFPFLGSLLRLIRQFNAYMLALKKSIEISNIDLVHIHVLFPSGLFALYLKKRYKLKYIITEHWTGYLTSDPTKINSMERFVSRSIINNADVVCPVSNDLKNALMSFNKKVRFEVIPNAVDTDVFKMLPHQKKKRILHISNLFDQQKNITGIIDVISELSLKRTDFSITIAGDGDVNYFRKYAQKLNLPSDLCVFDGEKDYAEVARLMNAHDFFLLFSNYENSPCVISEALVCGLPVISSDVGGIKEMIDENSGKLVVPKNKMDLMNKINEMLDNLSDYNSKKISEEANKIYSFKSVGLRYFEVYLSVLNLDYDNNKSESR